MGATPRYITQPPGTNSDDLATTAFVQGEIAPVRAVLPATAADHAALVAAVAEAEEQGVQLSAGEIATTGLSDDPIVLWGRGQSSSLRRPAGASVGPVYLLTGGDINAYDVRFDLSVDATAVNGVNLFRTTSGRVTLDQIVADGGVILDGDGLRNHLANITTISTGADIESIHIRDSRLTRFFWGILQANTTVGSMSNIKITGSEFDEMGSTYLLFNAPADGASIEDVLILGNTLGSVLSKQPFGAAAGYPHRGSFAGNVFGARLVANHAKGYGGELFRSEEGARAIVMALNTAKLDGKDGIEIIPNNAGGTMHTPSLFAVLGNVLDTTTLASSPTRGWGIGLQVYNVAGFGTAEALHDSVVAHNIASGWAEGLRLHRGMHRNLVSHNVITDSEVGIISYAPSLGTHDNLIVDAGTALQFQRGGILGRTHFRQSAPGFAAQAIDATYGPAGVDSWTVETGEFTVSSGANTYISLLPLGAVIDADIRIFLACTDTNYSMESGSIRWDGTELTYRQRIRHASGAVVISPGAPIGSDAGNLVVNIFNGSGSAFDRARLQVVLTGIHLWS